MKKTIFIGIFLVVLGFSTLANAALQNNGNGLIYDTDLNITWYDAPAVARSWNDQMSWASTLSTGGETGWRLPRVNASTGEMGHLYYDELGNSLMNGPFKNLIPFVYYYGSRVGWDNRSVFTFSFDGNGQNDTYELTNNYAMAVHDGNVGAPVPIPGAILLFAPGLLGIAVLRRRFKK